MVESRSRDVIDSFRLVGFRNFTKNYFIPRNKKCGLLNCKVHVDNEQAARDFVKKVIPNARTTIGMENPRGDDPNYKYRCALVFSFIHLMKFELTLHSLKYFNSLY